MGMLGHGMRVAVFGVGVATLCSRFLWFQHIRNMRGEVSLVVYNSQLLFVNVSLVSFVTIDAPIDTMNYQEHFD